MDVIAIRSQLATISGPLHEQLEAIDARLAELELETRQLRDARRDIAVVLDRLNGTPRKAAVAKAAADGTRRTRDAQFQRKVEDLQRLLQEHADELQDGFTASNVCDQLRGQIVGGLTVTSARKALEELRYRGVVRADRIGPGGGMRFKLA